MAQERQPNVTDAQHRVVQPSVLNRRNVLGGLAGLALIGGGGYALYRLGESRGTTKGATAEAVAEKVAQQAGTPPGAKVPDAQPATPTTTMVERLVDRELRREESLQVPADSVVKGDVIINGVRNFDNDPKTGEITFMQAPGKVTAPFGANVSFSVGPENLGNQGFRDFIKHNIGLMKESGCERGCTIIREWIWDGQRFRRVDP